MARAFHVALAATCLLPLACLASSLPAPPPLQPWPLEGEVAAAKAFAASATLAAPTGLLRADYLDTIHSVVSFWRGHQAANGSIIDPATGYEMQYSTPCFASAAALLVKEGVDTTLLGPASAALSFALSSMVNGSAACAQATCDFYAVPVMQAFAALAPLAAPALVATWTTQLQNLDPTTTYELTGQNWELTAATGEFIRMQLQGWSNAHGNWSLWEARVGRLATIAGTPTDGVGFWNSNGQFNDNHGMDKTSPHAYDAFADGYTSLLLDLGYRTGGYMYSDYLSALMDRAVWTHALFQGPWGEIPVGGRSGQHQWNEALMAAQYELGAVAASKAGDAVSACALRRAARLSHASIRRWLRADGAIQIVKNWFEDPVERWGYEGYSFFSQYNLLPMAWLVHAYTAATDADAIPECAAPADVGGVAFALPYSSFRKVFASAGGTYVEVMTGADPEYDSTGFYRVHFKGCATGPPASSTPCNTTLGSLLGPSAAPPLTASAAFGVASAIGGPWWRLAGDAPSVRRSLANNTLDSVLAAVFTTSAGNTPSLVYFTVQYVLWAEGVLVTESYAVAPGSVTVTASMSLPGPDALFALLVDAHAKTGACKAVQCTLMEPADAAVLRAVRAGDLASLLAIRPAPPAQGADGALPVVTAFGVQFPALVFDGRTNFTVAVTPGGCNCMTVSGGPGQGTVAYSVQDPEGRPLAWEYDAGLQVPSRNGVVTPVYAGLAANSDSPSLTYSVSVAQPA